MHTMLTPEQSLQRYVEERLIDRHWTPDMIETEVCHAILETADGEWIRSSDFAADPDADGMLDRDKMSEGWERVSMEEQNQ